MNKDKGKNKQGGSKKDTGFKTTPFISPEDRTIVSHSHKKISDTEKNPTSPNGETKPTDRIMAFATVIIAIATLAYTGTAFYQLRVMSDTLEQMTTSGKDASKQTDRIIKEATRIANSATESAKQGKKALDAAINNFRLEQRAWVGPTAIVSNEYKEGNKITHIKENEPFFIGIDIVNSGKTPAKNIKITGSTYYLAAENIPSKSEVNSFPDTTTAVLYPGMTTTLTSPPRPNPNKAVINALVSERKIFYVIGSITYDDVFGARHTSKYCMYLRPDLAGFSPCSFNNDVD